ncbi:hypothetical protein ABZP36_005418 [Zizania latifolia]
MLRQATSGGAVDVVAYAALALLALRLTMSYKSALYALRRLWRWADEWAQAYQYHEALASNYLGLKDHKLYPQVEEGFHAGGRLSPAELGEIMLANRSSPSRALRNVITKLQHMSGVASPPHRKNTSWSGAGGQWEEQAGRASADAANAEEAITTPAGGVVFAKDAPMREFKKLYGLIKIRSRKEGAGVVLLEGTGEGPAPAPVNGRGGDHDKEW